MLQTRMPVVEQVFGHNKAPIGEVLGHDFAELAHSAEALIDEAEKLPRSIKSDAELGDFGQIVSKLRTMALKVEGARKDEGKPLLDATRDLNNWFNEFKARIDASRETLEGAASVFVRAKETAARAKAAEEARKLREAEDLARTKAAESTGVAAARAEGKAENFASQAERSEEKAGARAADLVRTNVGGVTASAKTVWRFRIRDYMALQASMGPIGPYLPRADVEKAIRSIVRIQKEGTVLPGVEVFEDTRATFR